MCAPQNFSSAAPDHAIHGGGYKRRTGADVDGCVTTLSRSRPNANSASPAALVRNSGGVLAGGTAWTIRWVSSLMNGETAKTLSQFSSAPLMASIVDAW